LWQLQPAFALVWDAVTNLLAPFTIAGGLIGNIVEKLGLFPQVATETALSVQEISDNAANLAQQIDLLNQKTAELDQQYQDGKLTLEEYNSQKAELTNQSNTAQAALETEKNLFQELNAEYFQAQEQIAANNERIAELQGTIGTLNDRLERGRISQEEYNMKLQAAQGEIDNLVLSNRNLEQVQKQQIATQQQVNQAVNAISTAKTVDEFNKLRLAALETIKSYALTLKAQVALQRGLGNQEWVDAAVEWLLTLKQTARDIANLRFVPPAAWPSNLGWGGGWGWSRGVSSVQRERERAARDAEKAEEDLKRKTEKRLKEIEKIWTRTYKNIGKAIKDQQKVVDDLTKSIEDTKKELSDLNDEAIDVGKTAQEELASRFLEVQERLGELDPQKTLLDNEELQERAKLLQELDILQQTLNEADSAEAQRQANLTETEAILEARDEELAAIEEKRVALEEELSDLENQKAREEQVLLAFAETQKAIEQGVTESFAIELDKRLNLIRQFRESAGDFTGQIWAPTIVGQGVQPGSTITTNQTNNFNNTVNDVTTAQALSQQIQRALVQN